MLLWALLGVSILVGLVLWLIPKGRLAYGVYVALGLSALSIIVSFFAVLQGDSKSGIRDQLQGSEILDLRYAEGSSKRGAIVGNYSFSYTQIDAEGRTFLGSGSVPAASTRVYVNSELKDARLEKYQDYYWNPKIFPIPVWSFQTYEIHTPLEPQR